jgi:hypothetical protein
MYGRTRDTAERVSGEEKAGAIAGKLDSMQGRR